MTVIKRNDGSFLTLDCKGIQYSCCGAHRKGALHLQFCVSAQDTLGMLLQEGPSYFPALQTLL